MSKSVARRAIALVMVLTIVLAAGPGLAVAETRAGSTVTVGPGETVDGLDVAAATVVVHGTVNGDLSGAAADIRISESGVVTGDVNAAAASLTVDGDVQGSVSAGVATFVLGDTGAVGGSLDVGAADATLAGQVDGDATVGADNILVTDTAVLAGTLRYDGDLTQQSGASIAGDVVRDDSIGQTNFELSPIPDAFGAIYGLLANLALGAVLLLAFPGTTRKFASTVADRPVRAGGFGLLTFVAVPIALVVGLVAAAIVGFVPILGGVLSFVVFLVGLGALALVLDGYRRERRQSRSSGSTDAPTA